MNNYRTSLPLGVSKTLSSVHCSLLTVGGGRLVAAYYQQDYLRRAENSPERKPITRPNVTGNRRKA